MLQAAGECLQHSQLTASIKECLQLQSCPAPWSAHARAAQAAGFGRHTDDNGIGVLADGGTTSSVHVAVELSVTSHARPGGAAARPGDLQCTTCITLRPWLSVSNLLPLPLSLQPVGATGVAGQLVQVGSSMLQTWHAALQPCRIVFCVTPEWLNQCPAAAAALACISQHLRELCRRLAAQLVSWCHGSSWPPCAQQPLDADVSSSLPASNPCLYNSRDCCCPCSTCLSQLQPLQPQQCLSQTLQLRLHRLQVMQRLQQLCCCRCLIRSSGDAQLWCSQMADCAMCVSPCWRASSAAMW